jgi:hypothetical protein
LPPRRRRFPDRAQQPAPDRLGMPRTSHVGPPPGSSPLLRSLRQNDHAAWPPSAGCSRGSTPRGCPPNRRHRACAAPRGPASAPRPGTAPAIYAAESVPSQDPSRRLRCARSSHTRYYTRRTRRVRRADPGAPLVCASRRLLLFLHDGRPAHQPLRRVFETRPAAGRGARAGTARPPSRCWSGPRDPRAAADPSRRAAGRPVVRPRRPARRPPRWRPRPARHRLPRGGGGGRRPAAPRRHVHRRARRDHARTPLLPPIVIAPFVLAVPPGHPRGGPMRGRCRPPSGCPWTRSARLRRCRRSASTCRTARPLPVPGLPRLRDLGADLPDPAQFLDVTDGLY